MDNWVTVEDYGTVQQGRWETAYSYQVVSQNWVPGDYDSEGNEISPAHYEDVWDYVPTGSNWVDESYWGVVGTHQENQATWVPEQTTSWTEYSAGVPRVRFTATRSDTNFVFRVPSPGSGSDGMKDILVIWEGGLSLPSTDPSRMSVFMTDALQHTLDQGANSYTSRSSAELLDQRGNSYYSQNGVSHYDQSHSELRPSLLKLTRTESANGVATIAQTQIAAKSASFAGVVNVDGNLSVKGVIRVQPAGDLTMGPYTNGPQP